VNSTSVPKTRHKIRQRAAAALVAIPALSATPVVAAVPANAAVHDPSPQASAASVDEQAEQATFDDLRVMIDQFEPTGEVTFSGARRMLVFVDWSELYHDRGYDSRAVLFLQNFKQVASDPTYVPAESARTQLIGAADQLIAQLSDA
jgi:hypothetical protein